MSQGEVWGQGLHADTGKALVYELPGWDTTLAMG